MVSDFTMREGESHDIYVIVVDRNNGVPKDLNGATVTFVAESNAESYVKTSALNPTQVSTTTNPLAVEDTTTECAVLIKILPTDTLPVGQYNYEVRVKLSTIETIVYPLEDETATFVVNKSYTKGH